MRDPGPFRLTTDDCYSAAVERWLPLSALFMLVSAACSGLPDRAMFLRMWFGPPGPDPASQIPHFRHRNVFQVGKPVQTAQHPAQRVAQTAIQLRLLLQNFRTDAQILGSV